MSLRFTSSAAKQSPAIPPPLWLMRIVTTMSSGSNLPDSDCKLGHGKMSVRFIRCTLGSVLLLIRSIEAQQGCERRKIVHPAWIGVERSVYLGHAVLVGKHDVQALCAMLRFIRSVACSPIEANGRALFQQIKGSINCQRLGDLPCSSVSD